MPKAKAAALKALELDDTFAEAHYELGKIAFWYDWDWPTVERETKRASELDSAYTIYPVYLCAMGRFDEAVSSQEMRLRKLPLDLNVNLDMEGIYLQSGKYDNAMEQARKTLEIEPKFWDAYQTIGLVYERKKQYAEAITALERARSLDNNPLIGGYLGYIYAVGGKKAEAQKVIDQLKDLSKQRYVSPYGIAIIYAGLNDKDQAFEWLERAYDQRGSYMTLLKVATVFDNLRPDPRFKALLKRMNLPD
jgi:tetratricopeptide (TPR) repeat protein